MPYKEVNRLINDALKEIKSDDIEAGRALFQKVLEVIERDYGVDNTSLSKVELYLAAVLDGNQEVPRTILSELINERCRHLRETIADFSDHFNQMEVEQTEHQELLSKLSVYEKLGQRLQRNTADLHGSDLYEIQETLIRIDTKNQELKHLKEQLDAIYIKIENLRESTRVWIDANAQD